MPSCGKHSETKHTRADTDAGDGSTGPARTFQRSCYGAASGRTESSHAFALPTSRGLSLGERVDRTRARAHTAPVGIHPRGSHYSLEPHPFLENPFTGMHHAAEHAAEQANNAKQRYVHTCGSAILGRRLDQQTACGSCWHTWTHTRMHIRTHAHTHTHTHARP